MKNQLTIAARQGRFHNALAAVRNGASKIAVGAAALAAAPAAFAQSGLADAVTANVDTADLIAIGVVVMGITGIILMVRSGKKTAS